MPAPTPSWNLVRCYGSWFNQDGTKKPGSYKVSIGQRVTSTVDDSIIPAGTFLSGSLSVAQNGSSLDIMVPAIDDPDITPNLPSIQLDVMFSDGTPTETFHIKPSVNGPAVNLRQVLLPSTAALITASMVVGRPGGIAVYDADGDVVDTRGVKVVAGAGGSTGGTVTAASITDATIVGRALVKAVDAPAARAAIGAGTSSLALGSSSTTAKAGNWVPAVADITATGTRSSTTFLRGDGSWAVPSGAPTATTTATGTVQLAGDLGGTATAPTVPGLADKQDVSAKHTLDQLAPGVTVVIDYYKPVFGTANAWPASRPTTRTDLDITWRGPTDPGNIMAVGDTFDLVGP